MIKSWCARRERALNREQPEAADLERERRAAGERERDARGAATQRTRLGPDRACESNGTFHLFFLQKCMVYLVHATR